jgi:hypothetical protein
VPDRGTCDITAYHPRSHDIIHKKNESFHSGFLFTIALTIFF